MPDAYIDEGEEALERILAAGLTPDKIDWFDPPAEYVGEGRITDRRWLLGQARRRWFLRILPDCASLPEALVRTGWTRQSYKRHRDKDKRFAAEVDAIRGTTPRGGRPKGSKGTWKRGEKGGPTRAQWEKARRTRPVKGAWTEGFAAFRKQFFDMDTTWFQTEVINALENGEPGSVTLILLPPEHGKTTLIEDWLNFIFATNPDYRVIYASEKQQHGRKVAKRVKNRMDPMGPAPAYVKGFGPFLPQKGDEAHPQPWAADFFDVHKRAESDERDYNFVALGFGAAVAGTRCDLLVVDDVQSLKSLNQTDQIVDEFRQDWLSRPGSTGRTVILGTRVGENDFYQAVMDAGLVDHLIKYPAQDVYGRWLWPERYSPENYARMRRNVGESAWARNYQQQPTAAGERTFEQDVLDQSKDPLITFARKPEHVDMRSVIVGHDPGFGKNAIAVCGYTADKLYPLEWRVDNGLASTSLWAQQLDLMMDHWRGQGMWPAHLVIEDKYVGQGLFTDEAFLALRTKYGCAISGHKTGLSKYDDDLGVAAMARSFRMGEIVLPGSDDPTTQLALAQLQAELLAWRPHKTGAKLRQDLVMGLWFCWMKWRAVRTLVDQTSDRSNLIRTQALGALTPVGFTPIVDLKGAMIV